MLGEATVELRQLKYFVGIVDAGSMSRASQRLYVAQSALSKQLVDLESNLQTQLLRRSARGVSMTDAGEILYHHARLILRNIGDARDAVASARSAKPIVIVCLPQSAAAALAVPLLAGARVRLPDLDVRIHEDLSGNVLNQLREGRVDVAVFTSNIERQHISLHSKSPFHSCRPAAASMAAVPKVHVEWSRPREQTSIWQGAISNRDGALCRSMPDAQQVDGWALDRAHANGPPRLEEGLPPVACLAAQERHDAAELVGTQAPQREARGADHTAGLRRQREDRRVASVREQIGLEQRAIGVGFALLGDGAVVAVHKQAIGRLRFVVRQREVHALHLHRGTGRDTVGAVDAAEATEGLDEGLVVMLHGESSALQLGLHL
jgi:DNA-binding transcriptional LysR family regulator